MDSISDAIVNSCEPLIIPDITMHDVNGKTVIVAEIAPGLQRPYHIKSLGREQGTFVRVAGTTRQADQPTIRELTLKAAIGCFDQVSVPWTVHNGRRHRGTVRKSDENREG